MSEGSIAESLLGAKDFREKVNKVINLKRNIIKRGLKDYDFFFNKSIVLRALIAKMFIEYSGIDVDENEVLTAVLLCNVKKIDNAQTLEKIHSYAKEGADFLKDKFLFDDRFCKICEQLNRYSKSEPRMIEGDILEVVDQFTGLILSRPDRPAFPIDKALLQLQSNLGKTNNSVLGEFSEFVEAMQKTQIRDNTDSEILGKLVRLCEFAYVGGGVKNGAI